MIKNVFHNFTVMNMKTNVPVYYFCRQLLYNFHTQFFYKVDRDQAFTASHALQNNYSCSACDVNMIVGRDIHVKQVIRKFHLF